MYLQRIKTEAERQGKDLKKIASDIGMSEQNLHRCVRLNKIQAEDLKKIADILDVNIDFFFDEKVEIKEKVVHYGDGGAHAVHIEKVDAPVQKSSNNESAKALTTDVETNNLKDKLIEAQELIIHLQKELLKYEGK